MEKKLNTRGQASSPDIDKASLQSATEIVQLLVKTFSQMKIFSFEHENVKKFSGQLYGRLKDYLDKYWKLEIGIEEFSFTLEENTIYTDKQIMKSLPFFFFKDGMKMLFFYRDLAKEEFLDFLEIIQRDSCLPPEESDIVSSFWERDFANIRYYAPDEYLESKIGTGMEVQEYEVNKNDLLSGRIELDEEDKQALTRGSGLAQRIMGESEEEQELTAEPEIELLSSALSESELASVERLIQKNRETPQDQELLSLLLEMLYLEDRPDKFTSTLNTLEECLLSMAAKGEFTKANEAVFSIQQLAQSLDTSMTAKNKSIQKFLENIKSEKAIFNLKKVYLKAEVRDLKAYLNYLRLIGLESFPLLGLIYEENDSLEIKEKIQYIFKEKGSADISALVRITDNSRPELTKAIIATMRTIGEKKVIPHFAHFLNFDSSAIRKDALQALAQFKTSDANKILAAFLVDPEEDLRILAAQNLDFQGEKSVLQRISEIVQDKTFFKKSFPEKKAMLDFLSRTQTPEACRILESIVKKSRWFSRGITVETSLYAVLALENMGTTKAAAALKNNIRNRNKKIREACQSALKNIPSG